jgi:hypothetical protein
VKGSVLHDLRECVARKELIYFNCLNFEPCQENLDVQDWASRHCCYSGLYYLLIVLVEIQANDGAFEVLDTLLKKAQKFELVVATAASNGRSPTILIHLTFSPG